ncbi:hypothetical protein [Vibrio mediterranei]|uniref:hypothetical protein n=1 Tax=Vibrio mediterranei TaxID=689 RepID=UPI0040681FD3
MNKFIVVLLLLVSTGVAADGQERFNKVRDSIRDINTSVLRATVNIQKRYVESAGSTLTVNGGLSSQSWDDIKNYVDTEIAAIDVGDPPPPVTPSWKVIYSGAGVPSLSYNASSASSYRMTLKYRYKVERSYSPIDEYKYASFSGTPGDVEAMVFSYSLGCQSSQTYYKTHQFTVGKSNTDVSFYASYENSCYGNTTKGSWSDFKITKFELYY